jgi:AraC-like DNA-binding protein
MAYDQVRAWKPAVPGVREVFHARFAEHAYPSHAHDTWTLLVVDEGAVRYDLHRRPHGTGRAEVTILPPYVAHDGRPATSGGFRKRVIYFDGGVIGEDLIGASVDRPDHADPALWGALDRTHGLLARGPDDALEAESRLAFVVERVRRLLGDRRSTADPLALGPAGSLALWPASWPAGPLAERLRALLDARLVEGTTLAAAGRELGADPTHLVRSFTRTYGVPPHAYLVGRRIALARSRLLDGEPPAEVAAGVGFYDQAHFTRHFRRHVGTTPARFARGAPVD